ncbi:MAG: serine/threonine protein kinase [Acidobacteria bacterium]|nr:serine/threonine protein kinase [Acidobacteriota bacterium]
MTSEAPTTGGETLLRPGSARRTTGHRSPTPGLSSEIVGQSAERLRILALLYTFVFFMAAYFPPLLFSADRARFFGKFILWGPGAISMSVALLVAVATRSPRIPLPVVMSMGLAFQVASSYGIAAAEFLEEAGLNMNIRWLGLSWVAVWTLLFTVAVPTRPGRAVAGALLSVSSVPVLVGIAIATGNTTFRPDPMQFFFWLVFPYLLVVVMAYVGARVVYALGTEVSAARELGSYHLVERLGKGGMGEVWRAKHRMLARPAAIKLIRPLASGDEMPEVSEDARRRFEREAQAIARLRSPHTVTLFDFGIASDGAFYYVMELLEGCDLDSLVRRTGPITAERAVYLLRQICHSLSEAESCGLVHRDIKPANVFVSRYGEDYDFVKVLDFGIVKPARDQAETGTLMTQGHAIHGTPAFIAPEQALGRSDIDGRADIYSTGCVAYWLLTGQLVFTGQTPMELLVHHAHTPAAAPSTRTELPIPPALDQLVLSCLAKNPSDRPQSARDLSQQLALVMPGDDWTQDHAREWWARHQPV